MHEIYGNFSQDGSQGASQGGSSYRQFDLARPGVAPSGTRLEEVAAPFRGNSSGYASANENCLWLSLNDNKTWSDRVLERKNFLKKSAPIRFIVVPRLAKISEDLYRK